MGEFLKCYWQNTIDAATGTVFQDTLKTAISEDNVETADLVAELDAAWQANTFFG